jgi:hypothetical protein
VIGTEVGGVPGRRISPPSPPADLFIEVRLIDLAVADEDPAVQWSRPEWRKLWGVLGIGVASGIFLASHIAAGPHSFAAGPCFSTRVRKPKGAAAFL